MSELTGLFVVKPESQTVTKGLNRSDFKWKVFIRLCIRSDWFIPMFGRKGRDLRG